MTNEPYIETYTGKKITFLNPHPNMISIVDIAHSLSMQCRYTGHCKNFYSIAEHSLLVASLCHEENMLHALLHDASEAYLTDVATPIKEHLHNYREMECRLMEVIFESFGMSPVLPHEVKEKDKLAFKIEASKLLQSGGKDWINGDELKPYKHISLCSLSPPKVKEMFINEFDRLMKRRV